MATNLRLSPEAQTLERHVNAEDALVSSTLAWIEISRALLDVDTLLTYDDRLATAARYNGLAVSAPA
ncbi:MAG TPA: hypothetical protein VFZ63_11590 [Jiangellaceae bacterium]